ncbi:MAG: hypothetical protein V2A74_12580, partial [bacterium]
MFRKPVIVFLLASFYLLTPSSILADIILDNDHGAPAYTEAGPWTTSVSTGYRDGTYRYTTTAGAFATWTPYIPQSDHYKVFAVFRASVNRADDARYTIAHAAGTTVVQISQYAASSTVVEVSLGEYDFDAGTGGSVRLDAVTVGKVYVGDAIIFRSFRDDPPMIFPASRFPVRPLTSDTVTVTAIITDDDEVASASLTYEAAPSGTTQTVPAYDDGNHGDGVAADSLYGAAIPGQSDETTSVSFFFQACDSAGQESSSPAQSYIVFANPLPEYRAIWAYAWGPGFLKPT